MAKKPSGTQMEMLLPIVGKRAIPSAPPKKAPRSVSYEKLIESLRKKGLTKAVGNK